MNSTAGTVTGRTHFHIANGDEPMKFSDEFRRATKIVISADLSLVEKKVAEDLCRKQDQRLREKLASP